MRRFLPAFVLAAAAVFSVAGSAPAQSTPVGVFPLPGSFSTLPSTQIVFRGVAPSKIGSIRVVGSRSGVHGGHIAPDSDGKGGSFLPNKPFVAGETVTVSTGLNVLNGHNGSWQFKVIAPYAPMKPLNLPYVSPGRNGVQHFHSTGLRPASITVTKRGAPGSDDIFLTPQYGPLQNGPMLLDPAGKLIWFAPLPRNWLASDLRVQKLWGQRVLTWWQGVTNNGYGRGQGMIFNRQYHQIATVSAADGVPGVDLHEFLVTPQGQAYIIAYSPVHWPGMGRPLMDCVIEEIDIKTGLVLFEWHALDHIPLSESYFKPKRTSGFVFDPFHMNSISIDRDGNLIVSMRNTWAVYKINHQTGAIMWTLGSDRSNFKLGSGAGTAFQHDVVVQPNGTLTEFDDGAGPPTIHPQSRAIRVSVNTKKHTSTLVKQYLHTPALSSHFEGSAEVLGGGFWFVGWGQLPYFSEFTPGGSLDFDAHFTAPTSSYRAYRFSWSGQPTTPPDMAIGSRSKGTTRIYASWNGATTVVWWRVLAGSSPTALRPVGTARKQGFETAISAHSEQHYFAVQALGSKKQVLATSPVH